MSDSAPDIKIKKDKPTELIGEQPKDKPWELGQIFQSERPKISVMQRATTNQGGRIAGASVTTPFKLWRKGTVAPVGSAAALAALAGIGAYYGTPWALNKLRSATSGMPGMLNQEMTEEEIQKARKRMAIIAALTAGGLSVAANYNPRYGLESMANWDYVPKQASYTSNIGVMTQDLIPLDHAKEIVANDRFLTSGQKAAISSIFNKTPDQSGDASMADLTMGAINAGLGFAGGAVAGYALGKIFSLPQSVTRTASITGGLANALRASGLIS